jgi:hypothetical protein
VDLGLLVEGRLDLGKWVFQVPVLVGKGKRGPDLFEARCVLPVSQVPVGLQAAGKGRLLGSKLAAAIQARNRVQVRS